MVGGDRGSSSHGPKSPNLPVTLSVFLPNLIALLSFPRKARKPWPLLEVIHTSQPERERLRGRVPSWLPKVKKPQWAQSWGQSEDHRPPRENGQGKEPEPFLSGFSPHYQLTSINLSSLITANVQYKCGFASWEASWFPEAVDSLDSEFHVAPSPKLLFPSFAILSCMTFFPWSFIVIRGRSLSLQW